MIFNLNVMRKLSYNEVNGYMLQGNRKCLQTAGGLYERKVRFALKRGTLIERMIKIFTGQ